MNYASINKNDIVNGEGICVSLFVSGCPHHCPGCFNQETWDYNFGTEFTLETIQEIKEVIAANGILRNFSVLGGEPLAHANRQEIANLISEIRNTYGYSIKIYLWTGYIYEELLQENDEYIETIFSQIDFLIDGPFLLEQKTLDLFLRGSANQRVLDMKKLTFI